MLRNKLKIEGRRERFDVQEGEKLTDKDLIL